VFETRHYKYSSDQDCGALRSWARIWDSVIFILCVTNFHFMRDNFHFMRELTVFKGNYSVKL